MIISDGNAHPIINGQNVTLNCSVYRYQYTLEWMTWEVPDHIDLVCR